MTAHGIGTVARLELRQRMRTSRWPIVLSAWFLLIGLVTGLAWAAVNDQQVDSGSALYDVVTFFVLGLGMLVVPSLTATTINGDREHGVLATLQTTLLSAGDIVVGKLVASWVVALAFLVTALPFLALAWVAGGLSFGRVLLSLLVLVLVLAVTCTIGLLFSSLTARPVTSAVLTYLTVAALVFGTVITFGLSMFLVTDKERVQVHGVPQSWWESHQGATATAPPSPDGAVPAPPDVPQPTRADCTNYSRTTDVAHTERIWWLLPLNPFVVVADAAPSRPPRAVGPDGQGMVTTGFTPMRWISQGARVAKTGPPSQAGRIVEECTFETSLSQGPGPGEPAQPEGSAVWPYGLAFLLLCGAGATAVARRRLVTPVRRLPSGTRIA